MNKLFADSLALVEEALALSKSHLKIASDLLIEGHDISSDPVALNIQAATCYADAAEHLLNQIWTSVGTLAKFASQVPFQLNAS